MEDLTLTLEQALALRDQGALLVDARSSAEYEEATIPGALNVPILNNAERARIGTVYKQEGKGPARLLGVEVVAPKIPDMVNQVREALTNSRPPVIVFCWRGGMRSQALTTFLHLAGIPARRLTGGHKAFRGHVRQFFETGSWGRLIVLRGLTGVGKTRFLHRLQGEGYPVVDLEGLAQHRGSAFGALGLPPQPTQKAFEALLWDQLRKIPEGAFALAEGESRHIGKVVLPPRIYQSLQSEVSLWIETSLERRVEIILGDYPALDHLKEKFKRPLMALRQRLGGQAIDHMNQLLEQGEWNQLVRELMVRYYDPLYEHTKPDRRIEIWMESEDRGIEHLKNAVEEVLSGSGKDALRAVL